MAKVELEGRTALLVLIDSGLSTSTTTRLLQLALALERVAGAKLALVSGSLGCLRMFCGDEQLALQRATLAPESLSAEAIALAPRVRMGLGETLGSGPDLGALVVLGEGATNPQERETLARRFGDVVALGSSEAPWPVATRTADKLAASRSAGPDGLIVLVGDAPVADIVARLALLRAEVMGPVTLLDLHDAYADLERWPAEVDRAGPGPLAWRCELYARHRNVVHLDHKRCLSDLFWHEALSFGLRPYGPQRNVEKPSLLALDELAQSLWQRMATEPSGAAAGTEVDHKALSHTAVGKSEIIIGRDASALLAAWRAARKSVALLVDRAACPLPLLEKPIAELPLDELWLDANEHAAHAPKLLSLTLRSMLSGRTTKAPQLQLCESSDAQATTLRQYVAVDEPRTVLIWLVDAPPGVERFWRQHAEVAAKRQARLGAGFEPRVLVADVGQPGDGQVYSEHRIGAMQASSDIAAGVRAAAPGHLSLVSMLPPPFDKRFRRIFFEPGSLLPARKQRLSTAPSWYLHELAAALRTRQVHALVNLNGPFLASLHAARLAYSDYALPIVGVLHSLHVAQLEVDHLEVHVQQPLRPYDLIISPSHCGEKVMRNLLEQVVSLAERRGINRPEASAQIAVVPYGVETEVYGGRDRYAARIHLALPLRPLLLVSMMRFARYNKADLAPLVLTLKLLRQRGYDVELVLAGQINDPDEPKRLMLLATGLGVGAYVHLKTNLPAQDKHQLLAASDVFVALSDHVQETFGLGVVEAMAAGRPVVASAWDGFAELVRHAETGLLVPTLWRAPSDEREVAATIARHSQLSLGSFDLSEGVAVAPEALADSLGTLLDNRELRERMGSEAQRVARSEYCRAKQGKKIVACIEEAIQAAGNAERPPADRLHFSPLGERFGHYPSATPRDDDWLMLAPAARDRDMRAALLDALYAGHTERSEREVDEALLNRLGTEGLAWAAARRADCDDQRLLRAIKYGLVDRVSAAGE